MANFVYYTPTEIHFGKNTIEDTGELVRKHGGHKVLLHYGSNSAKKSGILGQVKQSLEKAGIEYVELPGVIPNPRLEMVYEGIDLAKKENVDFLLALGGGSVIDSCKAIGYGLANEGDVWDFYEHTRTPEAGFPIGVVLTIAAAGSEMSDSSVISNEKTHEKRGVNSNLCRARFAVMDPTVTETLPDYQTACGNTDILMHTMERYFTSGDKMDLTDEIAEGLMRTVIKNARILKKEPENYDARAEVMWASSLSHNGLTGCGNSTNDFASHALEHELSGMFDVAHGAGLAAIWGSWARYVMDSNLDRFVKFATNVMGVEEDETPEATALNGIEAMENFFQELGMPISLRELLGYEISDEQIDELAAGCARAKGGKVGSAKELNEEDMKNIYSMARG